MWLNLFLQNDLHFHALVLFVMQRHVISVAYCFNRFELAVLIEL